MARGSFAISMSNKFYNYVQIFQHSFVKLASTCYHDLIFDFILVILLLASGGALKPTDVDTLWVHVTCAWFRPEVSFASDEKMEPALGILSIPSNSFVKVEI